MMSVSGQLWILLLIAFLIGSAVAYGFYRASRGQSRNNHSQGEH